MSFNFAVIDAETDPFEFGQIPEPFIWGFYDGTRYLYFNDTIKLVHHIKKFPGKIYAHNGGKFDYHFLLPYIERGQEILIINGRLSKFKIGKATMLDSYNILPVGLAAMQKDKFDYAKMHRDVREKHMTEIKDYLRNDCIYLYDHVKRFIDDYGNALTLASAAMNQWKKISKPPQTTSSYYDMFYPFYYGGRVTPFQGGAHKGNFEILDINSAYPNAMMDYHPYGTKYISTKNITDSNLRQSFLTIKAKSIKALPFRTKTGIDFPIHEGIFHATGHEIISGLETKTLQIEKIINGYTFPDVINFSEYMENFYNLKIIAEREKDKAGRLFAKLFMNSLYGKFAANPRKYTRHIIAEYGDKPPEGFGYGPQFDEIQFFCKPLDKSRWRFYNVATAASITGAVRAFLWESINRCENVLYCDTDSVICEKHSLPLSDKLGEWKTEAVADEVYIAGKKLYSAFKNGKAVKWASKGVQLSPEQIKEIAQGKVLTWENQAPTFSYKKEAFFIERIIKKTI